MKKTLCILLAILMMTAVTSAWAEDTYPQPEGGKKFEDNWALAGGLIEIHYEEEGYRVFINLYNNSDHTGKIWEYSCYYAENMDALTSISSARRTYSTDADGEMINEQVEYQGFDTDGHETLFTLADNGSLHWTDGYDKTAGADLEFRRIGSFEGEWRSAEGEEPVWVQFEWKGLNEETYNYFVYLHRGDDATYTDFIMTGVYNEDTGKLVCTGSNTDPKDTETYEAVFSMNDAGKVVYEASNGIILEYDPLGGSAG